MSRSNAAEQLWHGYVGVQRRGLVALPSQLRERMHLDEAGVQLEITERDDGVFELRPVLPVPADQAWFWSRDGSSANTKWRSTSSPVK